MIKFIKRIIDTIKLELSFVKAESAPDTLPDATVDMINEEGYIVVHDHNTVRRERNVISRIMQAQFKGLEDPTPVIVVDNDFYKLSKETQKFVIEHELAHFTLHAYENECPDIDSLAEDELRKDREADVETYHVFKHNETKVLKALREMKRIINTKEYNNYFDLRIHYFKQYAKIHRRRVVKAKDVMWAMKNKYKVVHTIYEDEVVCR
ncbi:ImmA/IrrE family metallo-endopeptidase [Romboutsia ilealis]|uniref:ImmA/IrrE family metallo-endopeptidase n=1 Tax=Romboutsia ilealis TaxID=1115758 RepID=UPI00272B62B8|nr:ImmA/IrrE family metallo-endopeptidase [Romboutsia ilealis]